MLRGYLRLVVFALGLLVGVQGPAFVDQYAKRVSAHYLEVKRDFAGFQQAADQYFNGDVSALVAHHLQSPDVVFRGEAKTIGELFAIGEHQLGKIEREGLDREWPPLS